MTAPLPRLFDGFTFFNELDLLELRLAELSPVVEKFIIVEATQTFTGKAKPLHFREHAARFSAFADRIVHIVVDDLPGERASAWDREWAQRRAIRRGFEQAGAGPDDFALISDIDEIPRPEVLERELRSPESRRALSFLESELSLYFLNMRLEKGWRSPIQAPRLIEMRYARDPQALRATQPQRSKRAAKWGVDQYWVQARLWRDTGAWIRPRVVPRAAWHFSFLGGAEKIREKLSSYSHTEYATPDRLDLAKIDAMLREGRFIFQDDVRLVRVDIDESFPATVRQSLSRWAPFIA